VNEAGNKFQGAGIVYAVRACTSCGQPTLVQWQDEPRCVPCIQATERLEDWHARMELMEKDREREKMLRTVVPANRPRWRSIPDQVYQIATIVCLGLLAWELRDYIRAWLDLWFGGNQ
jgi:hypothetical protein